MSLDEDWFDRLPWFLREHIHRCRWTGFRDIQVRTFEAFASSDDHILVSAATSSGKTEAAMFPVVSSLYSNPQAGVGALYIGPLKALIDDQFERIEPVLRESELRITGWHGDVSQGAKQRLLSRPEGILQITPESLQNIVSGAPETVVHLFSNLRFVIIDEVHAFMSSDRGQQLLCCLQRLESVAKCDPRRIGLSATIKDLDSAAEWLSAGTGRRTAVVDGSGTGERRIDIRYFHIPSEDPASESEGRKGAITQYYLDLYRRTHGCNCIVFCNSRMDAEKAGKSLKVIARRKGSEDPVHVHHGSISKEYRKEAERDLKDPRVNATTVATVTLELGIDVGDLDRIVQIGAPYTCSGMVQRMGRSGRRGGAQEMTVYCIDDDMEWWSRMDGVSVDLVKTVAMAELVLRQGWTEPAASDPMPFGLLYHQTMEHLKSGVGARFPALASDVLSMHPFRNISKDDYKVLLRHMVSSGHLLRMEDGTLLIGPKAERIVFDRDFCSVFTVKKEIEVRCEDKSVGSIQVLPVEGELIQLAGRTWEVVKVSEDRTCVSVEECEGAASTPWKSGVPPTCDEVAAMMRHVLESDECYGYVGAGAMERLNECRDAARSNGLLEACVPTEDGVVLHPWVGTVKFDTLERICRRLFDLSGRRCVYSVQPLAIRIVTDFPAGYVLQKIRGFIAEGDPSDLVRADDMLIRGKYDCFVPSDLLAKSFAAGRIDMDIDI